MVRNPGFDRLMGNHRPVLGHAYVIYPQQRPESSESGSEAIPRLYETVLVHSSDTMIGVGHRVVVEVSADHSCTGTVVEVGQHCIHLFGPAAEGFAVFCAGFQPCIGVACQCLPDVGQGYCIGFEMAVIHPESLSSGLIFSPKREIAAVIEEYFALVAGFEAAQGDISAESLASFEEIVFKFISGQFPAHQMPDVAWFRAGIFLKTDHIGFVAIQKCKYGVYSFLTVLKFAVVGETVYIAGYYTYSVSPVKNLGLPLSGLEKTSQEEERRQNN